MKDKIIKIVAETLHRDILQCTPKAKLVEDLDADDCDMMEIMIAVEDEFCISIPFEDQVEIKTIQDIFNLVEKYGEYIMAKDFFQNSEEVVCPNCGEGVEFSSDNDHDCDYTIVICNYCDVTLAVWYDENEKEYIASIDKKKEIK